MKAKSTSSELMKKFIYYLDEAIVFVITILAIVFSDTLQAILKGQSIGHGAFIASWTKIVTASFIAIMLYGAVNNSFKYNEKDKPPLFKRIYTSVLIGIAWKGIINSTPIGG